MTNEGHGGWTVIILQCESMIHMLGALKSKSQCWVQRKLSKRLLLGGLSVTCLYAYERNIISCLSPKKFPWPQAPSNDLNPTHIYMQMFVIFSIGPTPAQAYPNPVGSDI